jgi:hypothetical protein
MDRTFLKSMTKALPKIGPLLPWVAQAFNIAELLHLGVDCLATTDGLKVEL